MKNKSWSREELVLALDAYFSIQPKAPDPSLPQIRELSDLLNGFPRADSEVRASNYRSLDSVVMKLMNFRSLDPAYPGSGLSAVGRLDREIWQEFAENRQRLREAADAVRSAFAVDVA
jgi:5-methylcytosine-specific restriction protein A